MKTVEDICQNDLSDDERQELAEFTVDVVRRYREAEHKFLDLVFELSDQEGMTKQDAKDYIDYLCRMRLSERGLESWDNVGENPLPWMDYVLSGSKHSNFFEQRVTDYSHAGLKGDADYDKFKTLLDERKFNQ